MKTILFREEDDAKAKALAEIWGCSQAAAIRRAVSEAAAREKIR